MREIIKETIVREDLIHSGETLVIGLSGGPDSLALTHALRALAPELGCALVAVHVNHGIRGQESDGEEAFVRETCAVWGIPLHVFFEDIPALSKASGRSAEEMGRIRRYARFEEVRRLEGADKIVVAHNRDDQVETFLMRMLRGAGLDGLASMRYHRDDGVIRPLLDCPRADIEAYCDAQGLAPRRDSSNDTGDYLRNRIRGELIPMLESGYNPNLSALLARNIPLLRQDADYLDAEARLQLDRHTESKLPLGELAALHPSIAGRVLRGFVHRETGSVRNVGNIHIRELERLVAQGNAGKHVVVRGKVFTIESGALIAKEPGGTLPPWQNVLEEGENRIHVGDAAYAIQIDRLDAPTALPPDPWTILIDAEALEGPIIVRQRRDGDRFHPLGMEGRTRKLKAFLIDRKIPASRRDHIMIFENRGVILWVAGYRMSELFKITATTRHALRIKVSRLPELDKCDRM